MVKKNISRKGRVKKHGGASRTFKQPYKEFSSNSPRSELSQQDKNILDSIVKNRRKLREKHGAKDTYKAVRRYNKKKTQKYLTSLQKKYHSMRPGPKKLKLKEKIAKEEMLLSSTDYGSPLEITDDDNFEDGNAPWASAVPVMQGFAMPKKLHPMKVLKKRTQTEPKPSPRRSQRALPRYALQTLAAVRDRERKIRILKQQEKRTKNAYKREEDHGDREDNDSGNESDDSWGDTDGDSWTTDDDEVGEVVASSRTKDNETRPASSTYGSASRKKKRKGKKEVKKKGKKGGKKTIRKS